MRWLAALRDECWAAAAAASAAASVVVCVVRCTDCVCVCCVWWGVVRAMDWCCGVAAVGAGNSIGETGAAAMVLQHDGVNSSPPYERKSLTNLAKNAIRSGNSFQNEIR